ncbi:MAG: hypothetical protein ACFFCO_08680 [Promethearchaeota archaeon]
MSEEIACPKCGEKREIHLMLLDTLENRRKERENRDGILLVASKAFAGKMACRKCGHMWKP